LVHSYYRLDVVEKIATIATQIENKGLVAYGRGFHFIRTIDRADDLRYAIDIYKCTIPAGAEIYYDATGLGVTNKIIINESIGYGSQETK
jgi:hypothetical protein